MMLEYLLDPLKSDHYITVSLRCFQSNSGLGYNFDLGTPHFRAYFHSGRNKVIDLSKSYLLAYAKSQRTEGRMDVVALASADDLIQELCDCDKLSTSLRSLLDLKITSGTAKGFIRENACTDTAEKLVARIFEDRDAPKLVEECVKADFLVDGIKRKLASISSGKLIQLLEIYSPQSRPMYCDLLPLSLLPHYLPFATEKNILDYLVTYAKAASCEELNIVCDSVFDTIDNNVWPAFSNLTSILRVLVTEPLNPQFSQYCDQKSSHLSHVLIANMLHANGISSKPIENLALCWLSDFKSISNQPLVEQLSTSLICEYLTSKKLVLDINQYSDFLGILKDYVQLEVCDNLPEEDLPYFAEFCSEKKIISYLASYCNSCSTEGVQLLKDVAARQSFIDTSFLLILVSRYQESGGMSEYQLLDVFKQFQIELFEQHSVSRTKIDCALFSLCTRNELSRQQQGETGIGTLLGNNRFTYCEAKLWYKKLKDEDGNFVGQEPKVLCRRNDCKFATFSGMENISYGYQKLMQTKPLPAPREQTLAPAPFYTVINKLFGIKPEQLHLNEQFVRAVAALNRWNEILDKLVCRCCSNPLHISEHSHDSMGRMAVGTTYWHCASQECQEYCKSVKISYCIGCQKVIDSRIDKHSCTPHEIKSYKKFYICTDCGSCCRKHEGFSGICAHCGNDHAYRNVEDRTKAPCQHCGETVSISPFGGKALQKHNANDGVFNHFKKLSKANSHLVLSISAVSDGFVPIIIEDVHSVQNTLYVYDLFECLVNRSLTREMLANYQQRHIYDLKVMETMVYLGKQHKRYGDTANQLNNLEHLMTRLSNGESFNDLKYQIENQICYLFTAMNEQMLWPHYNEIELPFIYGLHDLIRNGISIDKTYINLQFSQLELMRNQQIEQLRKVGIEISNEYSLKAYLEHVYGGFKARNLHKLFERVGPKSIIETDSAFKHIHEIDKTERGSAILKQFVSLPNYVVPKYQTMGTVTGRCTAKSPNLLGLPKQLRHIIRAETGMCIIECDYKQMEVGVLAALASDDNLINDFNSGDVYLTFADKLGIERDVAKSLFLSIIYGMHTSTLATTLAQSEQQVELLLKDFYARYRGVKLYQDKLISHGRKHGFVSTYTGLKRFVNPNVTKCTSITQWENNWFKNYPVQASAAIIFKKSIIELSKELVEERGEFKMLVPHYDAIVFQVPRDKSEQYISQVKAAMIRAMKSMFPVLKPQISVNASTPEHWS